MNLKIDHQNYTNEEQREIKWGKNGKSSRNLWDNIKRSKIHNIEVSQKEEKEIHTEQLFKEKMAENLTNS